jgi:hypothetical protein
VPNPLTGDFDAVLQVSGGTVNRLMASLHQNAGANSNLPSHPHSVSLRIGDGRAIDGVRGWVDAQLGVPRIQLINGATDRFNLEVDVRARYLADAGSTPIPEYVVGIVRAQYRIHDIDPNCVGWKNRARDYLWFRVVKDSVSFTGTAVDDINPLVIVNTIVDEAGINTRITRQIAALLATQFEAAPHKVSRRFRAGSMCSVAAPIGGSAIALPISLSGDDPVGQIASLQNLFLDDHDFAIALRVEVLMGVVEPMLADLRSFSQKYKTTINPFIGSSKTIHHTARVTLATAAWEATGGDHATLRIRVEGVVDSDSSLAPDISFQVNQSIWVYFDASGEALTLTAPDPGVAVQAKGLFATQKLTDSVAAGIKSAVKAHTQGLPSIPVGGRAELVAQLATLDALAGADFQDAVFTTYGVVMRGRIWLSPRTAPVVQFHKTAKEDGFSAYEAWAPGGRIDKLTWSWTWAGSRPGDSATRSDRFILKRPRAARSKWGGFLLAGTEPLPGIDGFGVLCLTLAGAQVNPMTGSLDTFVTNRRCTRYGVYFGVPSELDPGRLVQKLWPEIDKPGPPHPEEVGLLEVGGHPVDFATAANTLIVHFGERFDRETAKALEQGLSASRREDAGLAMIALFRDGTLRGSRHRVVAEVDNMAEGMGLPAQAMEDVGGVWCARFAMPPDSVAFRLITPGGGLTWMHDGPLTGDNLAQALDDHLRKSPPARPVAISPAFERESRLPALALRPDFFAPVDDDCPPHPLGRLDRQGAVVTFVHGRAASSKAQLAAIAGRQGFEQEDAPLTIAVVDGDAEMAAAMMKTHPGLVAVADPNGSLAKRFGIRVWPTTLNIDGDGVVASYAQGLDDLSADEREPQNRRRRQDGEASA